MIKTRAFTKSLITQALCMNIHEVNYYFEYTLWMYRAEELCKNDYSVHLFCFYDNLTPFSYMINVKSWCLDKLVFRLAISPSTYLWIYWFIWLYLLMKERLCEAELEIWWAKCDAEIKHKWFCLFSFFWIGFFWHFCVCAMDRSIKESNIWSYFILF